MTQDTGKPLFNILPSRRSTNVMRASKNDLQDTEETIASKSKGNIKMVSTQDKENIRGILEERHKVFKHYGEEHYGD